MRTIGSMGVALLLFAGHALCTAAELSSAKAELMGRVEHVFMHNFRDVTSRKSLDWGEVQPEADGGSSIRYKCEARIWDKDTYVMNVIFTFDADGKVVTFENVYGFPQKKQPEVIDLKTEAGMKKRVEQFFSRNFRDLTDRESIEWGKLTRDDAGRSSIRYKYWATIHKKDKKVLNQVFTFNSDGTFVSVKDVDASPQ